MLSKRVARSLSAGNSNVLNIKTQLKIVGISKRINKIIFFNFIMFAQIQFCNIVGDPTNKWFY